MKDDRNKPTNPNVAYSTAWTIRRSMNILRSFGLGHSKFLPHEDDDGDVEIEIDEAAVDRLCAQVDLESSPASKRINHDVNIV